MLDCSFITPIRLLHQSDIQNFDRTISSYKTILGNEYPEHLIADASPPQMRRFVEGILNKYIPGKWRDVSRNTRPFRAIDDMVHQVKTNYCIMVLGDVQATGNKDFISPCINVMNIDKSMVHIRLGGDPMSCGRPSNTSQFLSTGEYVHFRDGEEYKLEPIKVGDDVVWRYPKKAAFQRKLFFAIWSSIFRTKDLVRIIECIPNKQNVNLLCEVERAINWTWDWVNYCLPQKGWPPYLSWLEEQSQGILNLSSYLFALGREQKSWDEYHKSSKYELKNVPPAGEIRW